MNKLLISFTTLILAVTNSQAGGGVGNNPLNGDTDNSDINRRTSIISTPAPLAAQPHVNAQENFINLTDDTTRVSDGSNSNTSETLPSDWYNVTKYTDQPTDPVVNVEPGNFFNPYIVDYNEKIFDPEDSSSYMTYLQLKQFFPKLDVVGQSKAERDATYRELISVGKKVMSEFSEAFQKTTSSTPTSGDQLREIDDILVDSSLGATQTTVSNPDDRMVPHPRHKENPWQSVGMLKSQGKLPQEYNPNGKTDQQIINDANTGAFHQGHVTPASVASATKETGKKVEREVKKGLKKLGLR